MQQKKLIQSIESRVTVIEIEFWRSSCRDTRIDITKDTCQTVALLILVQIFQKLSPKCIII